MGLAICSRILDQHQGSVEVDSDLGRGTIFRITLPAAGVPTDHDVDLNTEDAEPSEGPARILVVDDEEMIRKLSRRTLESAGYVVGLAEGGKSALEMLADSSQGFDAVLLDWSMPDLDGAEVLRILADRGVDLPVVLSSGHAEQTAVESAGSEGIVSFLKKPYRVTDLLEAMSEAISGGDEPVS